MGFDFQVFYWSTFWISPFSTTTASPPPVTAPHKHQIKGVGAAMFECVCAFLLRPDSSLSFRKWQLLVHNHLFTRLHPPPLAYAPTHINPVSISQSQPLFSLFSLGGLRHTTRGCKTCLWGLLTVPSLRQLAQIDWPSLAALCWGWLAHIVMDSLSLIVSSFCLCVSPVQFLSWMSSPCPAAVYSLHLLTPLGRILFFGYI